MGNRERRLRSLEAETRETLVVGWPVCEGDVLIAYVLQGKRIDRHDDEAEEAFEHRVMAKSIAEVTYLMRPSDVNL